MPDLEQDGDRLARLNLIGDSPAFLEALRVLQRIARSDATVLIHGETGTGKELAARAIHYLGARRDYPFVPVNCGAIPDHLIENELFGHARGAYTDAREAVPGVIASAEGGTLFLDEVEALTLKAQVALLRFLEDGSYRRLGSGQLVRARTRIVAASNIDLDSLVRTGAFRADFMYRLQLLTLDLPPLRERRTDIVPLTRHFLRRLATRYDQVVRRLDPAAIAVLERHRWPGNVRELESLIHRQYLLSDDDLVRVEPASFERSAAPPENTVSAPRLDTSERCLSNFGQAKARAIEEFERSYLSRALAQSGGNVSAAARTAGKERRAFGRLLKKYGIGRGVFTD
jgi:two-component system response regulator GlrR